MERIIIRRVANGATMEIGRYVERKREAGFGFGSGLVTERVPDYRGPTVFLPGADETFWPPEAPPSADVDSIFGDTNEDGTLAVLEFGKKGGFGGIKVIVARSRLAGLAQTLAEPVGPREEV